MKINLIELNAEIEAGMVNKQDHPTLPLSIYKYSKECVYTQHWNEITLRCRGVVIDDTGEIVINGFPKFFNHNQLEAQAEYAKRKESDMEYTITEKMDGSLIQVCRYKGQVVVSSSGSFTSPQALKAAELLKPLENEIEEGWSYLFELIYPENRIVINYGLKVSLTLLAVRNTEDGTERNLSLLDGIFEIVPTVDYFVNLLEVENEMKRAAFINKEGFIVKFKDGYRIKLKYDEYCRLHKIVSGVNEKFIWEALRAGQDLETSLAGIPDELYDFVKEVTKELNFNYKALETEGKYVYNAALEYPTRKEQAAFVIKNYKDVSALVFAMLDGKDYSDRIWKAIEPETVTRFGFGQFPDEA